MHESHIASLDSDSSSGEEETSENIKLQKILVGRIIKNVESDALFTTPITLLKIDWEKVKFGGMSKEQLKSMWRNIILKEKLYRTAYDVIGSFMDNPFKKRNKTVAEYNEKLLNHSLPVPASSQDESQTEEQKPKKNLSKGEKKALKDKYPSKPLNGYQLFCRTLSMGEKKVPITEASSFWKELEDDKREEYYKKARESQQQYLGKLEKFIEENPSDEYAKELYSKAQKLYSKPSKKSEKSSGGANKRTLSNGPSPSDIDVSEPSITSISSPSKKKKVKKEEPKVWTAFDVFVERKVEEMKVENPTMEEEEIMKKLKKKFNKLSDEKKEKYVEIAEERNDEG